MIKIQKLPIQPNHSLIVCLVAIMATLAILFDNQLSTSLIYQRDLISNGEYWRVFTGHFFHTNAYHYALNMGALFMLWLLHGHFYSLKSYTLLFLFSSIICSIGLYYFDPTLIRYVGLSGVLHGIFVFGACMDIKAKDKTGYLLLLGLLVKVAHEQFYGASTDVIDLIDASVAINAHLWGAVGGAIFSIVYLGVTSELIGGKKR
jgi:rhomboid family GlyGly-CTERM serine protease|tara:strand:- start:896 stop:1507 length:612 start_codon:yes stop_codon:yes gene_type:complete